MGPGDPKKKGKPAYFSVFYNSLSKGNPFGNTGKTWEKWLSSESTLGSDLWNTTANSFWGVASLLDGNTYVNLYKGQKEYWSSSSEERAKADAEYLNNFVEGTATYAPLAYVGGELTNVKIPKSKEEITYGRNTNSEYHTFRHTFNAGYSISEIKSAVNSSMKPLLRSGFPEGVNFKGTVVVDGVKIKYNAWKFNDGTWNIGSIKPPR